MRRRAEDCTGLPLQRPDVHAHHSLAVVYDQTEPVLGHALQVHVGSVRHDLIEAVRIVIPELKIRCFSHLHRPVVRL